MDKKDFETLIQHSLPDSLISNSGRACFGSFRYLDLFLNSLWYQYNGSTRQEEWDYQNSNGHYIPKPYWWDSKYDTQIDALVQHFLALGPGSYKHYPASSGNSTNIQNDISTKNRKDDFLFFTVSKSLSVLDSLSSHLRNSFAHGSFNRVGYCENEEIVLCDRNQRAEPTFFLNLYRDKGSSLGNFADIVQLFNDDEGTFIARCTTYISNKSCFTGISSNSMRGENNRIVLSEEESNIGYFLESFCNVVTGCLSPDSNEIGRISQYLTSKFYCYCRNNAMTNGKDSRDYSDRVLEMLFKRIKTINGIKRDEWSLFLDGIGARPSFEVVVYSSDSYKEFVSLEI